MLAGFQLDWPYTAKTMRLWYSKIVQSTVTSEYAAKFKYSDVFLPSLTKQWDGNDDDSTYFELAPRLSLGETTGQNLSFGPVKDVLIATTWEA